jgi:hypothetical protein
MQLLLEDCLLKDGKRSFGVRSWVSFPSLSISPFPDSEEFTQNHLLLVPENLVWPSDFPY